MVKQNGFTLIELMIVVAIIGVLASIALPAYHSYTVRAQVAEAMTLGAELKKDIKEVYVHSGEFPADNRAAGLPLAKHLIGNYVKRIEVRDGAIHMEFGNKVNKRIAGKILSLQPLVVEGSPTSPISWNCGMAEPPEGMRAAGENRTSLEHEFLPFICRGA